MSFNVGSTIIAEVRFLEIHGEAGVGFHRLSIGIEVATLARPENQGFAITDLEGELRIETQAREQRLVGNIKTLGTVVLNSNTFHSDHQVTLNLDIDRQKLERIEEIRAGGGVRFLLLLWAKCLGRDGMRVVRHQETVSVNQGTWVELLERIGYARMMLLEIPIPDQDVSSALSAAHEHLVAAQDHNLHGRYRDAVGACRDVLESMGTALGDRDDQDAATQQFFANTRSFDKAARIRAVRRALRVLCHPSRHADANAADFEWNALDARTVLTWVAALLRRVGQTSA